MEKEKKGCLIPVALMAASIICIIIGLEYDIHILYAIGFMLPAYGGTMYNQYMHKDKKWSLKKHLIVIIAFIIIVVSLTFIKYGKLW